MLMPTSLTHVDVKGLAILPQDRRVLDDDFTPKKIHSGGDGHPEKKAGEHQESNS